MAIKLTEEYQPAPGRMASPDSKVALVHERFNVLAGSEMVLCAMHDTYPDAPVFTAFADSKLVAKHLPNVEVHTSFLQKLPLAARHHQKLLPLYMLAFEQFDMSEYNVVISSSHCAAKSVITKPDACHICYCHSPMRYAWDLQHSYSRRQPRLVRVVWSLMASYVRMWDQSTASRVDYFIANSRHIAARIRKFYGKPSVVIHPPVDIDRFHTSSVVDDYYLLVGRLAPYKCVDMAIKAFNSLGWRLVVIGDGEQERYLKKISRPNIEFKGYLSDGEVVEYLSHCKGFVHAAEEDFGINMAEAIASGRPVVAYGVGGARDIIRPGVNGVLFNEPKVESLVDALKECQSRTWDSEAIRQTSFRFGTPRFKQELASFVEWAKADFAQAGLLPLEAQLKYHSDAKENIYSD